MLYMVDMARHLPSHHRTTVHSHSPLADEATLLFAEMVPCAHITLYWSVSVRCGTSCTLDHNEWWTSVTYCSGNLPCCSGNNLDWHFSPRKSEGICFYRRWFVCLCVCDHDNNVAYRICGNFNDLEQSPRSFTNCKFFEIGFFMLFCSICQAVSWRSASCGSSAIAELSVFISCGIIARARSIVFRFEI